VTQAARVDASHATVLKLSNSISDASSHVETPTHFQTVDEIFYRTTLKTFVDLREATL
jgi:hypothetical protein